MGLLKFLIGFVLAVSSLPAEGNDGWFPVERGKVQEGGEEDDPSIWTLFSKNLGAEKILVRFPSDPTYRYTATGALEISAYKNGDLFQLTVEERGNPSPDLLYKVEGKWVREHFTQTQHHFYHFKIVSDQLDNSTSRDFFSSFLIEEKG